MARPTDAQRRRSDEIRQKIQADIIIDRLTAHINGELEMTQTQIAAANALLDRSIPKLQQIQHVGDENGGPVRHVFAWKQKS